MVHGLVKFFVLLTATYAGGLMKQYEEPIARVFIVSSVFVVAIGFQALITLHPLLHNPFLHRRIDVAHEAIVSHGLRNLAEALTHEDGSKLPAAVKAISDGAAEPSMAAEPPRAV